MLKNIRDVMNNINSSELDTFFSDTNANFICTSDIKETRIDYSWLSVLEDTLPNIDKIVRSPKKNLIQEEEVVIVEKTKKIAQETIKHLAEHSENIQALDENNDVVPKKLLNVYREDTSDLYENRFIYTLVGRLDGFINRQLDYLNLVSNKEVKKEVSYKADTIIENKKINIELAINESDIVELDDFNTYKDRVMSCYEIISGFRTTEMIKELVGCSPVRSPLRKTNLLLREPNFQKAVILWEYLDKYEYKDPKVVSYDKLTDVSKETKDEFTLAYFIDSNAIDEKKENLMKYKDIDAKLNRLINEYVYEDNQNISEFIEKTKNYYLIAQKEKDERLKSIADIYKEFIVNHNKKINELNKIFE